MWPFNTPTMVARQICTNGAKYAEWLGETSRRGESIGEHRRELMSRAAADGQDRGPRYAEWSRIYWREMNRVLEFALRNPDATSKGLTEIVERDCDRRRDSLKRELEQSDPRR
jgi:hypothetical protein